MRGTPTPQARMARPGAHHAGWRSLGWKLLLALAISLLLFADVSLPQPSVFVLLPVALVVWGGLIVVVYGVGLLTGTSAMRTAWLALALGAYLAVSLSGIASGTLPLLEALGPVAALTLVPHLGRRDLAGALRDWTVVFSLALYAALGIVAMWAVIEVLGPVVFLTAVLLPPLVFEAVTLAASRLGIAERTRGMAALVLATLFAMTVFALTQFNPSMTFTWSIVFGLLVGLLVGSALLVALLSRPLVEMAFGSLHQGSRGRMLAHSFAELSHGPILIALAIYIPMRLLIPS